MFVIMQCFDNLQNEGNLDPGKNPRNIALALSNAGLAITVTSLTDIIVFGIGATTVRSTYCTYTSINTCTVHLGSPFSVSSCPPFLLPVLRCRDPGRVLLPGHCLRRLSRPRPQQDRPGQERPRVLLQAQRLPEGEPGKVCRKHGTEGFRETWPSNHEPHRESTYDVGINV